MRFFAWELVRADRLSTYEAIHSECLEIVARYRTRVANLEQLAIFLRAERDAISMKHSREQSDNLRLREKIAGMERELGIMAQMLNEQKASA